MAPLNFASTSLFTRTPTRRVVVGWAVLRLCSLPWIVRPMVKWLRHSTAARVGSLLDPTVWLSRWLIFPHFCAGEQIADAGRARADMGGVSVLLDHSVEEGESDVDWETNLANKLELLRRCEEVGGVVGVPVKPTSLVAPQLLEELTVAMVRAESSGDDAELVVERALTADPLMRSAFDAADRNLAVLCAEACSRCQQGLSGQ